MRMVRWPGMLLVGGAGRNSGKTRLSCALIRSFGRRYPLVGLKVTAIQDRDGPCPRGNEDGCGVCTSLEQNYLITREDGSPEGKDTSLMLEAGAERVFWLRVLREQLLQGAQALLRRVGQDALCICESNSLRQVVEPGVFIIARAKGARSIKPSSRAVLHLAHRVALSDADGLDITPEDFDVVDGGWILKEGAGGGGSSPDRG